MGPGIWGIFLGIVGSSRDIPSKADPCKAVLLTNRVDGGQGVLKAEPQDHLQKEVGTRDKECQGQHPGFLAPEPGRKRLAKGGGR